MKISQKGIDLIKKFEGFEPNVYVCPAGKKTIGYGHVIGPKEIVLTKATSPITEETAEQLLKSDLNDAENVINSSVKVTLTQGQFDALISLVYNWGGYYFKGSNGLRKLNAKDYNAAMCEFFDAKKGVVRVNGKVLNGLVKRRQEELNLWKDHWND